MYLRADLCHHTRCFVSHNQRWYAAACASIVAVDIASADSAGFHLNQNIVRAGNRAGDLTNVETTDFF